MLLELFPTLLGAVAHILSKITRRFTQILRAFDNAFRNYRLGIGKRLVQALDFAAKGVQLLGDLVARGFFGFLSHEHSILFIHAHSTLEFQLGSVSAQMKAARG
jgi:hypothetical protein